MNIRKLTTTILCLVFGFSSLLLSASAASEHSPAQDWIADPDYPLCGGYYRLPSAAAPGLLDTTTRVEISADELNYQIAGQSQVTGHVTIQSGPRTLKAPSAHLITHAMPPYRLDRIRADGPLYYSDPTLTVWGNVLQWQQSNQQIQIADAEFHYYPHHGRGRATTINRQANGPIELSQAFYTTCPPHRDTWALQAAQLRLDPDQGRGQAHDLKVTVHGVPIFYLPYFDFPLDKRRKTGWLYPNFGSSTESGQRIQLPFYWNIAPNLDATLSPTYLTARGLLLDTDLRYLTARSQGRLELHWLPHDRKYQRFQNTYQSNPLQYHPGDPRLASINGGHYRFAAVYEHHSVFSERLRGDIHYRYVSDDNYFIDLGNALDKANTTDLLQEAALAYRGPHWHHTLRVQAYQSLHPLLGPQNEDEYDRLPQWVFSSQYPEIWRQLQLDLQGEWVNYYHRADPFTGQTVTHGQRLHFKPGLSWQHRTLASYVVPRIQWDILHYDLTQSPTDIIFGKPANPIRTTPIYDLNMGLFFERPLQIKQQHFMQTLEPKLYYLYVPYRQQSLYPNFDTNLYTFTLSQLYRDNRFTGRDRLSNANQVSLSLTSRLLATASGEERMNFSIGEIIYFTPRKVNLCDPMNLTSDCHRIESASAHDRQSALLAQWQIHLKTVKAWLLTEWDPKANHFNQSAYTLQWQPRAQTQLNLGYYWMRQTATPNNLNQPPTEAIQQTDVALTWPITQQINLLANWQYDIQQKRTINLLGGLAYQGCCFSWQIAANRYLRPQEKTQPQTYRNGLFFTVAFRGLSSLGTKDSQLSNKIPGYQPLDQHPQWQSQLPR